MRYFSGVRFGWGDHVPRCSVWIDRTFPDFYAFNFAATGTIWGEDAGGKRRRWQTPVAWWTQPGRRYAYGCGPDESWDHFYLTLRGPRVKAMFAQGLLPPGRAWHAGVWQSEQMRLHFLELLRLVRLGANGYGRAVHLLEHLFLLLHRDPHDTAALADSRFRRLHQLAEKIRLQPQLDWDLAGEAARMGLSVVHFRRSFRLMFGSPGHQYLLRARLDLAARLLRLSHRPIKDIAEASGVPDLSYFTRLFRLRMGTSPARYRQHAGLLRNPTKAPGPA